MFLILDKDEDVKMKGVILHAKWDPKPDYAVSTSEMETKKVIDGNKVWRYPEPKLEDLPTPEVGPKDLLVRIKACGICGSDIHMSEGDKDGYILYPGLTRFPCVLGHEFSGIVEKVGKNVRGFKEGDMVTSEEMIWCGECVPCRNGLPNHCVSLEEIGFTINGAFAEHIRIGAKYCWKIDSLLNVYREESAFEAGSLTEPTSVAYNAMFIRAGGFKPGAYVVIYGAGPIGLAAIGLAKAAGASNIIVFEVEPPRIKLAKEMGAAHVFNPLELAKQDIKPHEKVMEITDGLGADFQVEAAGAPTKTLPEMERSLAINGKIAWIGRGAEVTPIYLERFQVRRSQIFGSQGHSGHGIFPSVIRLMASGRIDMTKIITRRYTLSDAVEALEQARKREDGKITIKM